jgi:hypothetical protein
VPQLITLARLRAGVQETIEELVTWFVGKPRLFQLARPEQQIQFELATRVRERIRAEAANRSWDRLFFDATPFNVVDDGARRPPPIFVDTRQLFGVLNHKREPTAPDVAIAVHVLRGAPEQLSFDANGVPTGQPWVPVNMRAQGMWVEQRVAQFERLSHECCDGALLAIYANDTGRRTAVDARDIASWASWQKPVADVWWAVRHFRAKVPPR